MRIKKNINLGIIGWSNTKFLELTLKKIVWLTVRELQIWSGSSKVKFYLIKNMSGNRGN